MSDFVVSFRYTTSVVSLCQNLGCYLYHFWGHPFVKTWGACKKETSLFKMVLSFTPFNKEVDNMSYEKFITDFLNIKPSELSKISTSTKSDGSIFVKVKLVQKVTSCPFCHNAIKVHDYYDRKLTHSTFSNRKCTIIYLFPTQISLSSM